MRLQPDPSIYMKMTVKEPGLETSITQSEMELLYTDKYVNAVIPEAYERLILDCIYGDQQHFVRRDELQAAWAIFTPGTKPAELQKKFFLQRERSLTHTTQILS